MSRGNKRSRLNHIESTRVRNIKLSLVGVLAVAVGALATFAVNTAATPTEASSAPRPIPTFGTARAEPTTVAFLGDSYTEGAGSSKDRTHRWSTTVSNSLGWSETIIAIGGTGFVSGDNYVNQLPRVVATGADVVVISGGRNDVDELIEDVKRNAMQVLGGVRAGLPEARIIVLSPWWDDDEAPDRLTDVASAMSDAAASVGAEFIDSGQPLADRPDLMSADGIHPNDAGYAAIAATVTPLLDAGTGTP